MSETPEFSRRQQSQDARRAQIMAAAAEVFFESGYAEASMSTILKRTGGSRATLYAYFPTKEALFAAIVREKCNQMHLYMEDLRGAPDLRAALLTVSQRALTLALSDVGMRTLQLVVAEARRTPVLADVMREAIAEKDTLIIDVLRDARAKGQVRVDDLSGAALTLRSLFMGDFLLHGLLGASVPDEAAIRTHCERVVDAFLKLVG